MSRNLQGIIVMYALFSATIFFAPVWTSNNNAVFAQDNLTMQTNSTNATSSSNATIPLPIPIPVVVPTPLLPMTLFEPPPGYDKAREDPSFAVRIPFADREDPAFEPATIAIPMDMTVVWFNDDQLPHTVTMNTSNSQGSSFDSGIIPPMGFFTHKFTEAGTYEYYDRLNPSIKGRVTVGDTFEIGDNMNMLAGGDVLPFNMIQLERLTVSFVPRENATTIPPNLSLTYNISITNGSSVIYSNQFVDSDGILDLELVPASNTTKHFVTWGPDFADADDTPGEGSDGTYHVQGPVLIEDAIYLIQVSIVARDDTLLPSPITDTFALPSVGSE